MNSTGLSDRLWHGVPGTPPVRLYLEPPGLPPTPPVTLAPQTSWPGQACDHFQICIVL